MVGIVESQTTEDRKKYRVVGTRKYNLLQKLTVKVNLKCTC